MRQACSSPVSGFLTTTCARINGKIQVDERIMSAGNDGICAFRGVDVIGTTGDDLNGNAEKHVGYGAGWTWALDSKREFVLSARLHES
jgi:hypothetical protein